MKIHLKDPVSGLSHLLGVFASMVGLVILVASAALIATPWHVVSFSVYGASLILLYSASTLYHLLPTDKKTELRLRKIDHMMIFILIAGTYTPICLVPLRGGWGWGLFGAIWGLAAAGITLKALWIKAPRWFSTLIYIVMGWLVMIAFVPLGKTMPRAGLFYLILGGVLYSTGGLIYGLKWPRLPFRHFGFHEVFHIFVLLGSLAHFAVMYLFILKM